MGMFDTLKINVDRLPVPDVDKKRLAKSWLQTKDFDCTLTTVTIDEQGEIEIVRFEHDWDTTQLNAFGTPGVLIEKNRRTEKIHFHGFMRFCTITDDDIEEFFEFSAKFTDGRLQEIKLIDRHI